MNRLILIILTILSLSSCYSRKGAIRRFCSDKTFDTSIVIRDTVYTENTKTDTIFSTKLDSIVLVKDNLIIRYRKIHDSIYLSGEVRSDTIYLEKIIPIQIQAPCPDPNRITTMDKIKNFLSLLSLVLILVVILFIKKA